MTMLSSVASPQYSKQKGRDGENAVVDTLCEAFPHLEFIERKRLTGSQDQGDITGIPGVTIEVKNHKSMALAEWVDQAEAEKRNAGTEVGVVWHKRPRKTDPLDWYVTMSGAQWVSILGTLLTHRRMLTAEGGMSSPASVSGAEAK